MTRIDCGPECQKGTGRSHNMSSSTSATKRKAKSGGASLLVLRRPKTMFYMLTIVFSLKRSLGEYRNLRCNGKRRGYSVVGGFVVKYKQRRRETTWKSTTQFPTTCHITAPPSPTLKRQLRAVPYPHIGLLLAIYRPISPHPKLIEIYYYVVNGLCGAAITNDIFMECGMVVGYGFQV